MRTLTALVLLVSLECGWALAAGTGEKRTEQEGTNMEPRIVTMDLKLVGFQRLMRLDDEADFKAGMKELRAKLFARLDDIPDVSDPGRLVGRWQFVRGKTRVYFCAVQVDSLERFKPDHAAGLVGWDGGTQTFATWRRPNNQMGAVSYDAGPGYGFDGRFISDFEAFELDQVDAQAELPPDGTHGFWLPVVPRSPRAEGRQTARLIIRRFTAEDWVGLQELGQDKESSDGAIYDHPWPTSVEGSKEMAAWCAGQEQCFAVCLQGSGTLIGFIRLSSGDGQGQLEVGHVFHTKYRDGGYATEAMRHAVGLAFADESVASIIARNAVDWAGQLTPLTDLGFKETARGTASFAKDAQGNPIEFTFSTMVLTREEWVAEP